MTKPVIAVNDVSLAYSIYNKPVDMLKEALFGGVHHDSFWALRDINLKVEEGERVGIIGPNGAGKSTLLQLIAGKLEPTKGSVTVNGNISSLLSMVPAWNTEENGLDNIRNNLLIKGVPEEKVPQLTDEIIEFAEIGQFIFHPVKTYSTGMGARLSFAIATATEPEILIVDEVLGTGDGYFAWKAMKRMQDFCDRGKALLFVSHSVGSVQQMCDRVIWIQNGTIRMDGEAGYVLKQYELDFRKAEDEQLRTAHAQKMIETRGVARPDQLMDDEFMSLRLVPESGRAFSATHFVRSIEFEWESGEAKQIPLEWANVEEPDSVGTLDTLNCEWGRLHEHNGALCRILARATGRQFGGQFVVRVPEELRHLKANVGVKAVSVTDGGSEGLALEYLDMKTGNWCQADCTKAKSAHKGWFEVRSNVPWIPVEEHTREQVAEVLASKVQEEAEITSVEVITSDGSVAAFVETQPFEVKVNVMFHKQVDLADVGIKITRADGVYVFWQSSGQSDGNIVDAIGERSVSFKFDKNMLGAGTYSVNAHVTNGWKFPENYPYTDVFARAIDTLKFRVLPEHSDLDFGLLNVRVPVELG